MLDEVQVGPKTPESEGFFSGNCVNRCEAEGQEQTGARTPHEFGVKMSITTTH